MQKEKFEIKITDGQSIWISQNELKVLLLWRDMKYGSLTLKVQDGVPMDLIRVDKQVRLSKDDFTKLFSKDNNIFDGNKRE